MKTLARLYALNAALLIAHEIDSANWREMLGLSGDVGEFAHILWMWGL